MADCCKCNTLVCFTAKFPGHCPTRAARMSQGDGTRSSCHGSPAPWAGPFALPNSSGGDVLIWQQLRKNHCNWATLSRCLNKHQHSRAMSVCKPEVVVQPPIWNLLLATPFLCQFPATIASWRIVIVVIIIVVVVVVVVAVAVAVVVVVVAVVVVVVW